jgi:lysozyme family protein
MSFLHGLKTWRFFGKGWNARVVACEALAYRMAYGESLAPTILATKQKAAAAKSAANKTKAKGSAAGAGASTVAGYGDVDIGSYIAIALFVAAVAAVLIFAFKSYQESQRASALEAQLRGATS